MRPEGLGKLKNVNNFIGTLTSDHPASSIAPQPIMLLHEIGMNISPVT
jgi:hypothetical protein